MEMELYNTTDKTKVLPKFNYEGKMTMKPHESKKIEDYMGSFYKPYAKIGIVVRPITRMGTFKPSDVVEKEVKKVVEDAKEIKVAEIIKEPEIVEVPEEKTEDVVETVEPVEEVKEETEVEDAVEEPVVEEISEIAETTEESEPEVVEETSKKLSEDDLKAMKVADLRALADEWQADLGEATKKADIIKVLLDFQNK